ncbi:SWI5-dependent HO expression protein 4 [Coemansia sp. Benny D115]|nr:SWI5-dependent HO expression protein 4 [Coemansia sp. Benny D115]
MTTLSATARQQAEEKLDQITAQLQANGPDQVQRLLERARIHAALGNASKARTDIAHAAALTKEPKHKDDAAQTMEEIERAMQEIALGSGDAVQYADKNIKQLVDLAVTLVGRSEDPRQALTALEAKIKQPLQPDLLCCLVDAFHQAIEKQSAAGGVAALAATVSSSLALVQTREQADAAGMAGVATSMAAVWEGYRSAGDTVAMRRACEDGAAMYAAAACALARCLPQGDGAVRAAYAFFIRQVWPAAGQEDADALRAAAQGLLRLLNSDRAVFVAEFLAGAEEKPDVDAPVVRLLGLLGAPQGETHGLWLLVASQLVAACNSLGSGNGGARSGGAGSPEMQTLQRAIGNVVDGWVQADVQAERRRGLWALASLYEAGVGADASAELWRRTAWMEELWEQGEFDTLPTQGALLRLADACSADTRASQAMKRAGNALVQTLARGSDDVAQRAAVVLAKWSVLPAAGPLQPGVAGAEGSSSGEPEAEDADPRVLADKHIESVVAGARAGAAEQVLAATEALGYLCLRPALKDRVASDDQALPALFAFARGDKGSAALRFAALMLVRNLTRHRPVLTEEQRRVQQLQRLGAQAGQDKKDARRRQEQEEAEERKHDSAESVSRRSVLVCKAGVLPLLVQAGQTGASESAKDVVAEVCVALATTVALRGLLVQQGVVRVLLALLTPDALPKSAPEGSMPRPLAQSRDRLAAFALAKIAISVPPHLAFQHPREIVRLLLPLLAEESEPQALLMRFEALLALTNLASAPPGSPQDVRGYLAIDLNGLALIEMVLLSDHVLVRRAATELVCNLVYDPRVFARFAKDADKHVTGAIEPVELEPSGIVELPSDHEDSQEEEHAAKRDDDVYRAHRLHLLVALADVDDAATRSAAAGALAVLSNDDGCCRYLFLGHPRASQVLLDLISAEDDSKEQRAAFMHRVAVIWANALGCGDQRVRQRIGGDAEIRRCLEEMASDAAQPYYGAAKGALDRLGE